MRYAAGHKQQTNERILRAAGRLFRQRGYAATGVDAVMASANLTPGGFYSHFHSKADLLAETLDTVFREAGGEQAKQLSQLKGRSWLHAFVSFYLSRGHRDSPERGCPMAALAVEVARLGGKTRAVFDEHLHRMIDAVAQQFDAESPDRERAIAAIAMSLGGLTLARAAGSGDLSEEILSACRKAAIREVECR